MAKEVTFDVSKRGGPSVTVTFKEPESLEDPRWQELVSSVDQDVNTLACQALRVKIQAGAREELDGGEKAVQDYVNTYQYKAGGRGGTRVKAKPVTKELSKKAKFTPEQLEALREAGFPVEA